MHEDLQEITETDRLRAQEWIAFTLRGISEARAYELTDAKVDHVERMAAWGRMSRFIPTPEEIATKCARIRATWPDPTAGDYRRNGLAVFKVTGAHYAA
ncbi:MAG: hypothetical protein AAGJ40_09115 [Planctomycetota bacterium]